MMPNPPKPQPKPGKKNLPPWLKDKDGKKK